MTALIVLAIAIAIAIAGITIACIHGRHGLGQRAAQSQWLLREEMRR